MEDLKVALQDYTLLQRKLKQSICLELWKKGVVVMSLLNFNKIYKYFNYFFCSKSKTSF